MQCAVRIGLVYLISGFGGSLMSALFIQSNVSVGASGALFGLIGSMLSELITNWSLYANKVHIYMHFTAIPPFISRLIFVLFSKRLAKLHS
jgi:membrane associated rhomboid family serine protease